MDALLRLRKWVLTPSLKQTRVAHRGFYARSPESVAVLEEVGRSFLAGYAYAVGSSDTGNAHRRLEELPLRFRGFAYEGAAMGYAILDGLRIAGRGHTANFLAGPGLPHLYMAYVGIGWAMARLPRWRWRAVFPSHDPLRYWLALDGYGFHQAYFHTDRYVRQQRQDPSTHWPVSHPSYVPHAIDQGIGRAMWFVEGTDVTRVAARIEDFAPPRRPHLWSGVGLAATYAGGAAEAELHELFRLAGPHQPQLLQGSAFAAEARVRAGLVTPHTEEAVGALCATTVDNAVDIVRHARQELPDSDSVPAYQVWRDRIADRFASLGRC